MSDATRARDGGDLRGEALAIPIAPTPPAYRVGKRAMDLLASAVGLIVTAPVMFGIAAAIRLESPGQILFRQERLGLGGKPFRLYKFRTMYAMADQNAHRRHVRTLIRRDGEGNDLPWTWVPLEADPRVTRLGGLLRRSHLDELPQLINVLRGEMSVVGPRPPIPYEVEVYEPWHLRRLSVVPGLTGLWQVRGWGKLSFDEGVALDIEYIEQRSFTRDLGIILRTLWQILRGRQF